MDRGHFARRGRSGYRRFHRCAGRLTILLWRATERLFEAGEAQRKHAERVAERQADVMKRSLDLAARSANIPKLASLSIDRPWIKVDAHLTGDLVFGNEYIET